ncbi:glycosyltransferase [Natrononativus amylolyticus]|uniref:glycosyltransferase n=1 Tax=Natrononativus amylolyticus TaxID=2963434 RepID=UPI0020CD2067|nr:glycosyltransferase [Natrononativus amylolyticus]
MYAGDHPPHVDAALESVFRQTYEPAELVVVKDGPLDGALDRVIETWADEYPTVVTVLALEENRGLGTALQVGLEYCSYDLVARMDADDVAVPERLEKQVEFMLENPTVDVVGGYVAEFETNPERTNRVRTVPSSPHSVARQAPYKCPINHPTVMFRKRSVLAGGGYSEMRSMQDYELWMRLLDQGYTLANLPEVLVNARAGRGLIRRRGGLEYAKTEFDLQRTFRRRGYIGVPTFLVNVLSRIPLRLLPKRIRAAIYSRFLRDET